MTTCPKCGSDNITLSHRLGTERYYRYLYPKTPYRCKDCWERFWLFTNPLNSMRTRLTALLIFLLILLPFLWPDKTPSPPPVSRRKPGVSVTAPKKEGTKSHILITRKVAPPAKKSYAKIQKKLSGEKSTVTEPPSAATRESSEIEPASGEETSGEETAISSAVSRPKETTPGLRKSGPEPAQTEPETEKKSLSKEKTKKKTGVGDLAKKDQTVSKPVSKTEAPMPETQIKPTSQTAGKSKAASQEKQTAASSEETDLNSVLENITWSRLQQGLRFTVTSNRPLEKISSFTIQSPLPKLVVDLKGVWVKPGSRKLSVSHERVQNVRFGLHPDKLRMVVDFSGQNLPESYKIEKSGDRMTINLTFSETG